jgi:hypothetical protein
MKKILFTFIMSGLILLLIIVMPVSAALSLSPAVGYTSHTETITITGNFTTAGVTVLFTNGNNELSPSSIAIQSNTSLKCTLYISKSEPIGVWDLTIKNNDGWPQEKSNAFTIRKPMTLTSISPAHARLNNDSVDFTLVGTYLSKVSDVFLYNNDYDNITAVDVVGMSATKVEGTFDLTDTDVDTYDVCVVDDIGTEECDLSFEITTDEVGSIAISSSPSGASIYVDGSLEGTTPDTVDNLEEGSYKVVLKKSGYNDWGKTVKVTAGDTSTVNAYLDTVATVSTPVPTTRPTTVKTTRVSTIKVPTTWPSATIPVTTASPVDPAVALGAAGVALGLGVLRRR